MGQCVLLHFLQKQITLNICYFIAFNQLALIVCEMKLNTVQIFHAIVYTMLFNIDYKKQVVCSKYINL